jgi:SPBc2 prophage-derived uncharacterized protein yonG|nr:MAG TPA: hypothetical protein [Caudoviricetes sp.]
MAKRSNAGNVKATKRASEGKTVFDKNVKIEKLRADEDTQREYYCCACGKAYKKQDSNFCKSLSPLFANNNGYVHICKKCTDKYYYNLVDLFSGNEEKAMNRICQLFDWYYSDEIFAATRKISADRSRVCAYPSKMNLPQYRTQDKCYIDTIRDRESVTLDSTDDINEARNSGELKVAKKTINFFGLGYTPEQYRFLQDQYDDWTHRHECRTKSQEEVFKNLCIAQLNIQIAQQTGGKVKDAMDSFQNLLGTANLKPCQTNENALADQNTFGTLIKKWENEKPISEPDPEWKDVDGIVRYIHIYFLGHLCKMMGIKNSYSRMYDEEMEKYHVEKPEYEGDDEALFDAVFSLKLNKDDDNDS